MVLDEWWFCLICLSYCVINGDSDVKTNVAVFKTLLDIEVKGGINVIKQGTLKQVGCLTKKKKKKVGFREQVEDLDDLTIETALILAKKKENWKALLSLS